MLTSFGAGCQINQVIVLCQGFFYFLFSRTLDNILESANI